MTSSHSIIDTVIAAICFDESWVHEDRGEQCTEDLKLLPASRVQAGLT